jgi:hypothetical protein
MRLAYVGGYNDDCQMRSPPTSMGHLNESKAFATLGDLLWL